MKANPVNVLNKTVYNVCSIGNQVQNHTQDISFLLKYTNFNKNLLLSMMGASVNINTTILHYNIDKTFVSDHLVKQFILGVLSHLNTNTNENYYLLIESGEDIPSSLRSVNISVPSIIQVSLVDSDRSELVSLLDSVRSGNFSKLSPVINQLVANHGDATSYTVAILQYLVKAPELSFYKESVMPVAGSHIVKTYENLGVNKQFNTSKISRLLTKNINITNILEATNFYIKRGHEQTTLTFKEKSFNDPFYPPPTTTDYLATALRLFLTEHNLEIDGHGRLYHLSSSPYEPFAPFEPFQPSEPVESSDPSMSGTNHYFTKLSDLTSIADNEYKIEAKIKQLLELTESTETTTY